MTFHLALVPAAAALAVSVGCGSGVPASQTQPATPSTPAAAASPTPDASTPDPTGAWATATSADGHYSLRYPSTLRVTYNCAAEVWLDQPSAPLQTTCPLVGDTGELLFFFQSVSGDQRDHLGRNDGSFPSEGTAPLGPGTTVVIDGVSAMRYQGTFPTGGMGVVAGERQTVYVAYAHDRTYSAIYSQNAGTPEMSSDFKLVVEHTLTFSG